MVSYLDEIWEIFYSLGLPNEIIKIILIDFKGYGNLILNNPFPLMPKYFNIDGGDNPYLKYDSFNVDLAGWRFNNEFTNKYYGRTSNILIRKDDEGIFGGSLVNPKHTNNIYICDKTEDFKNCRVNCLEFDKVRCGLCGCLTNNYIGIELYDVINHTHTGEDDSFKICRHCENGIGKIKYCPYDCGRCCVGIETYFKTTNEELYNRFFKILKNKMGFLDEDDFDENLAGRCFDCLKADIDEKQDDFLREIDTYNLKVSFDGVGDDLEKLKNNLECNEKLFELCCEDYEKKLLEGTHKEGERERESRTIDKLTDDIWELNFKIWMINKGINTSCNFCGECENLILGFNNFECIKEYFDDLPSHGLELWRLKRNIDEFIECLEEYFFEGDEDVYCDDCFLNNTNLIYKDDRLFNALL